jgi:large subunit ribosomal protein L21
MAYAIFKTGGNGEGGDIQVGAPNIEGATVVAKVLRQFKAPKVTAFQFRRRKQVHIQKGHRQPMTEVEIVSINA